MLGSVSFIKQPFHTLPITMAQSTHSTRHKSLLFSALTVAMSLGLSQVALSQPSAPEVRAAKPPDRSSPFVMQIPDLPALGNSSRYLPAPQDLTVHLVLKLGQRQVYVYRGEKVLAKYPVAIGRPSAPTPTGSFQVFEMVVNPAWQSPWTGEVEAPGPDGSLGLRWIGFTRLSGGVIGFHGTPNVASIGRAVSHGCVRMRNEDVVKLFAQIKVGTPVRVEP
jgi:lipoprotein-anchoring transpeptidase ErfK/SrfK